MASPSSFNPPPKSLVEMPFGLSGRIFRSPMPFRAGDEKGQLFRQYQEQHISVVVLLVDDAECLSARVATCACFTKIMDWK
jgi:hypothetical protein